MLQDLEGFDEEAERRQQATADAASRGRSPFKQGRSQAELGPGPLASGLTSSGGSGGSNAGDCTNHWEQMLVNAWHTQALQQQVDSVEMNAEPIQDCWCCAVWLPYNNLLQASAYVPAWIFVGPSGNAKAYKQYALRESVHQ